jgi:hypothetical protein
MRGAKASILGDEILHSSAPGLFQNLCRPAFKLFQLAWAHGAEVTIKEGLKLFEDFLLRRDGCVLWYERPILANTRP